MNAQDVTTTAGALTTTAGAMLIGFGLKALGAIAVSILGPSAVLTRSILPAGLVATREIPTSLISHSIEIASVPDAPPTRV